MIISLDFICNVSNNRNISDAKMKIQILGFGCPKCKQLEKAVQEAVARKLNRDGAGDMTCLSFIL